MKRLFATRLLLAALAAAAAAVWPAAPAVAGNNTFLRNICRIKGQEESTLNGLGLVVGLNGTGEAGDEITMKNLARAMELMGTPVSTSGRLDSDALQQLSNIKNVALVMVTATVPGTGARRGDNVDCQVSAINGKSLAGGRLVSTALLGPNTQDKRVYGLCQGALQIDDDGQPMVARIHAGCQIQQDIYTPFYKDGYITLVLDKNHADFLIAEAIVGRIQDTYAQYISDSEFDYEVKLQQMVHAVNASNIRVKIPEIYRMDPVGFAAELLEINIYGAEPEARVFINPRTGSVIISGDVEIGDVIVTHRNLLVEATGGEASFASVDPNDVNKVKLDRLIKALKNLAVPADDIIEVIRGIDRLGKLHAKLIIE